MTDETAKGRLRQTAWAWHSGEPIGAMRSPVGRLAVFLVGRLRFVSQLAPRVFPGDSR